MAYAYSPGYTYAGPMGRGYARLLRQEKRKEAEARNARTPHDRTKAHRLGKCDCSE